MTVDARARTILFDAYWTSKGWIDGGRTPPPADLAHALRHRTMFRPLTISHGALISRLMTLAQGLRPGQVSDAFLASLSSRRLDLRSGLCSLALARDLKRHRFGDTGDWFCSVCGAAEQYQDEDISVLNFERHKWGGVRLDDPLYQMLDLRELNRSLPVKPLPADVAIFREILRAVSRSAAKDTPAALEKRLAGVLPSSKEERNVLIEILAAAGVLAAGDPDRQCGEFSYAAGWRGADGYDAAVVKRLFGRRGVLE